MFNTIYIFIVLYSYIKKIEISNDMNISLDLYGIMLYNLILLQQTHDTKHTTQNTQILKCQGQ